MEDWKESLPKFEPMEEWKVFVSGAWLMEERMD